MRLDRAAIPPIGQGLAVIALLAGIALAVMIAVGCYMAALHIRAHRLAVEHIDARVALVDRQIHALEYELEYRGRFTQLEQWRQPLGLGPVGIDQRAADPRDLASVVARQHAVVAATRVDAAPHKASYLPAARQQMDDLVAAVAK